MRRSFIAITSVAAAVMMAWACGDDPSAAETDCAGTYPLATLETWFGEAAEVLTVAGVSMIDVDELKGCLAIGVSSRSVIPAVEVRLNELGIPRAAVYFVILPSAPIAIGL